MLGQIQKDARGLLSEVVSHRRHLHQYPELSFQEEKTAAYICQVLDEASVSYVANRGGHGVVATVGDPASEKAIALRADMDALPIQENNDVSYRSKNDGVMHACGHDVHTASLLGAACILKRVEAKLPGLVRCVFQPAEEKLPGGASLMIADGILEDLPKATSIFGQHVHPPLEVGKIGVRPGIYMASADELFLHVCGKGGHAALPHELIDPVVVMCHIVLALQQLTSRRSNPTTPTVLSFGKVNSTGGATNIIPDEIKLEGTFRTLDETWRSEAHTLMQQIATSTAAAHGASCELEIRKGYPFLLNDPALTQRFRTYAEEYLGPENVIELPIRMTSEDFSFYSHQLPACFYRLGTGNQARGITSPIHTSTFDIDEASLEIGMGLMAWTAFKELSS